MSKNKINLLINFVARFQKSSRIDTDINANHIDGIIATKTFKEVINVILNNISNSSSYIISGAYGTGKSTFCLLLSSLFINNNKINDIGFGKVGSDIRNKIRKLIEKKYHFLPIIGQNEQFHLILRSELIARRLISNKTRKTASSVVKELTKSINSSSKNILIVVDEMGKFLENAAKGNDDAIFFQNLAELADRSNKKLILIGVLHQSFLAYSENLAETTQREWKKVQGRFVEIPLINSRKEQIGLISKSFQIKNLPKNIKLDNQKLVKLLPNEIKSSFDVNNLCYPLHPITASLISDISNSGIGQNQRTLFTFLSSGEQGGLREFLETNPNLGEMYMPYNLWRYVTSNSLIYSQSSKFSHRFHTANDCIDKARKLNDELSIKVLQVVILIWIFGKQGLEPTKDILNSALAPIHSENEITNSLNKLLNNSIIKFRKHKKQFEPFEGSDFDLEEAIKSTGVINLPYHIPLQSRPVMAHRHAVTTGTLSYAFIYILNGTSDIPSAINSIQHEFACFCIVLDKKYIPVPVKNDKRIILWTCPKNNEEIKKKLKQLAIYKQLIKSSDIVGDQVARRELNEQIEYQQRLLDSIVNKLISETTEWKIENSIIKVTRMKNQSISNFLTILADRYFDQRVIIQNELINRNKPSSSANGAIKILIKSILQNETKPRLGLAEGWPVEVGIYYSILHKQIHIQDKSSWEIKVSEKNSPRLYK